MNTSRALFMVSAFVALAVLGVVFLVTRPDHSRRNYEIFTEMVYSRGYESYSPNPNFPDGKTLQPLVAGVVPRGRLPFRYGTGPEEAERAGEELVNPIPPDDAQAQRRGAELFAIYCLPCHDARGNGQGPVTLRGMIPPPSLHGARAVQMKDGTMFHVITRGQGNMASYAGQLDERERWMVIDHVRRLQQEGP